MEKPQKLLHCLDLPNQTWNVSLITPASNNAVNSLINIDSVRMGKPIPSLPSGKFSLIHWLSEVDETSMRPLMSSLGYSTRLMHQNEVLKTEGSNNLREDIKKRKLSKRIGGQPMLKKTKMEVNGLELTQN